MWCNPVSSPMLSVRVWRPLQSHTSIARVPASSARERTTPFSSVPFTTRSVGGISLRAERPRSRTLQRPASTQCMRERRGRSPQDGAVPGRHPEVRRDVRARSRARSLAGGTMRGGTPAGVLRRRILSADEPSTPQLSVEVGREPRKPSPPPSSLTSMPPAFTRVRSGRS